MPKHDTRHRPATRTTAMIYLLVVLWAGDLTRTVVGAATGAESSAQATSQRENEASEERVRSLGLGTRRMAARLLHRPPPHEVREASTGSGATRLMWPVENGTLGRGFGFVRKSRKELPHLGVDISARTGTPIRAAAEGLIAYAGSALKGYGNYLMIVHREGAVTSYAHCSRMLGKPGQRVMRGDVVALVGSTGISKGPHLHFELRVAGKAVDPMARFGRVAPHERPLLSALLPSR